MRSKTRTNAARRLGLLGGALLAGCASLGGPAQLPATSGATVVTLPHVPPVAQTAYQCGPAALASVMRSWGRPADVEAIGRSLRMPGARGVLNFSLVQYAQDQGLWVELPEADDGQALREWLRRGVPPIVMLQVGPSWLPAYHFLVVTGWDEGARRVYANTGQPAPQAIPAGRFETRWRRANHWMLIACPPERVDWAVEGAQAATLAQMLERQGQLDLAKRWYRTALAHDPSSVPVRFNLATVSLKLARWDEATPLYEALGRERPAWSAVSNNLAWMALQQGQPDDAIRLIDEGLARGGTRTYEILDTLGVAYCRLRRYPDAEAAFAEAASVVPTGHAEALALIKRHRAGCRAPS